MPSISVIVPVYNVEKYIHRCVDSMLNQTFTDFELILVDDGSPDNCGKICDEYALKDNRIHVIHQNNGGLSAARNTGIDWVTNNSSSDWLMFVDSDDWLHPATLEILLSTAKKQNTDISICELYKTNNDFEIKSLPQYSSSVVSAEELYVNHHTAATVACGKLYKIFCFDNIRYPKGKLHEDEFITYKILFKDIKISYVNTPLYYYYQRPNSIMNADWSPNRLSIFDAYDEQLSFFKENGYNNAYTRQLKSYLWLLSEHISLINNTENKEYLHYKLSLRKKLRAFIRKFRKETNTSHQNDPFIYENAYPFLMKIYWILCSFINKIKKQ